ncbi:MAG: hypothetical protein WBZ50_06875, partial [Nitrososphaeraceae archaeon]
MDDFINGLLNLMIKSIQLRTLKKLRYFSTFVKQIANANHTKLITVDKPCTPELGRWSLLSRKYYPH